MNLLASLFKSLSRPNFEIQSSKTLSKELRLQTDGYSSNELMKIGAAIQNLLNQHGDVTVTEWIGIHNIQNTETSVWLFEVFPHAQYNVQLELQSLLDIERNQWSVMDRSKQWDLKLMFQ